MIRLLRDLIPASVLTLLVSEAVLILTCFVTASYLVLDVDPTVFLLYDGGVSRILVAAGSIILALYFHDLYSQIRVRSRLLLIQQACQAMGIAFLVQALLIYGNAGLLLPRWLMMLGSALSLIAIVAWRVFYDSVVLRAMGDLRVLFVGNNSLVQDLTRYFVEHPELGMRASGYVVDDEEAGGEFAAQPVLGTLRELRGIVDAVKPDRIVVGLRERRNRLPVYDLLDLRLSGIRIEEAATTFETVCKRISIAHLRPGQLIYSTDLGPRPGSVLLQSVYSMVAALAGVLLAAPVMLVVAVAVKLSSRGPVLFRQQRVGFQGRIFILYKFRSMRADAEEATGAVWAARDDPRVTRLGRWLRRLRLDELPQFLNVLRGDMVIVGPRPERPEFVKVLSEEIPFYRQRHCVKPGITGWAQINHKYGNTVEDSVKKLEYDLYYIKNLSPALDAYIVFHTLKTMLLSRGAH